MEAENSKFKVHISCSDSDKEFVDQLVKGLKRHGRFKLSITPGEKALKRNWKSRIGALIAQADTILFVVSPLSVQSETFVWEMDHALQLSKRIQPILHRPLRNVSTPVQLADIKYLRFENPGSFENRLQSLVTLLDTNNDWLRMHTQLYLSARLWEDAGNSQEHLLSSTEFAAAKNWTFERPAAAPKPTELHMRFIQASEEVKPAGRDHTVRQQTAVGAQAEFAGSNLERKRAQRRSVGNESAHNADIELPQAEQATLLQVEHNRFQRGLDDIGAARSDGALSGLLELDEQAAPAQLQLDTKQSARRHNRLHAVLGSVLLALTAAAVWQALDAGQQAPQTGVQTVMRQDLSIESTQRLFVIQKERIEEALQKVECLLASEAIENTNCISPAKRTVAVSE